MPDIPGFTLTCALPVLAIFTDVYFVYHSVNADMVTETENINLSILGISLQCKEKTPDLSLSLTKSNQSKLNHIKL